MYPIAADESTSAQKLFLADLPEAKKLFAMVAIVYK